MFVELQHTSSREALYRTHAEMTMRALVLIFQFPETRAKEAVGELWRRYNDASEATRDRLIHEDPVNLAAEIAEKPWRTLVVDEGILTEDNPGKDWVELLQEPFATGLRRYNAEVRAEFEPALKNE
jgi:hypothetical protein